MSDRSALVEILTLAAEDPRFLARLIENPLRVLLEFDLRREEREALERGDLEAVSEWLGELDEKLKTWFIVRRAQERW